MQKHMSRPPEDRRPRRYSRARKLKSLLLGGLTRWSAKPKKLQSLALAMVAAFSLTAVAAGPASATTPRWVTGSSTVPAGSAS